MCIQEVVYCALCKRELKEKPLETCQYGRQSQRCHSIKQKTLYQHHARCAARLAYETQLEAQGLELPKRKPFGDTLQGVEVWKFLPDEQKKATPRNAAGQPILDKLKMPLLHDPDYKPFYWKIWGKPTYIEEDAKKMPHYVPEPKTDEEWRQWRTLRGYRPNPDGYEADDEMGGHDDEFSDYGSEDDAMSLGKEAESDSSYGLIDYGQRGTASPTDPSHKLPDYAANDNQDDSDGDVVMKDATPTDASSENDDEAVFTQPESGAEHDEDPTSPLKPEDVPMPSIEPHPVEPLVATPAKKWTLPRNFTPPPRATHKQPSWHFFADTRWDRASPKLIDGMTRAERKAKREAERPARAAESVDSSSDEVDWPFFLRLHRIRDKHVSLPIWMFGSWLILEERNIRFRNYYYGEDEYN